MTTWLFPCVRHGVPCPKRRSKRALTTAAETLRISHLLTRKTERLSGGEMQRVSIGRAIVRQPRIFLMDEPLSNLDAKLRESLRIELEHIQKKQGSTTLFVTHDQVEALTLADRIGVLRGGRIVQLGTPHEIYNQPASIFVAQLVGTPRINLLPAHYADGTLRVADSGIAMPLPANRLPADLTLGVRPEDVQICADGDFAGEVVLVEPLGVETIVYIQAQKQRLLSIAAGMSPHRIGESVRFRLDPQRLHLFTGNGARIG